jgi:hypothetical protein
LDEPRWYHSAEEYRAIQGLTRDGRYQEALDRAGLALTAGFLGRKHAARLNSLICWLYTEPLNQTCPRAILHGEEAVRLAGLVNDEWIKCEALARLVVAYCHVGDTDRARIACQELAVESAKNEGAITGGNATVRLLEAIIAGVEGDDLSSLVSLEEAEQLTDDTFPLALAHIRAQRLCRLVWTGRLPEAQAVAARGIPEVPQESTPYLEWGLARAWLAVEAKEPESARLLLQEVSPLAQSTGDASGTFQWLAIQAVLVQNADLADAKRLATTALQRAIATGRLDLVRMLRARLRALL